MDDDKIIKNKEENKQKFNVDENKKIIGQKNRTFPIRDVLMQATSEDAYQLAAATGMTLSDFMLDINNDEELKWLYDMYLLRYKSNVLSMTLASKDHKQKDIAIALLEELGVLSNDGKNMSFQLNLDTSPREKKNDKK